MLIPKNRPNIIGKKKLLSLIWAIFRQKDFEKTTIIMARVVQCWVWERERERYENWRWSQKIVLTQWGKKTCFLWFEQYLAKKTLKKPPPRWPCWFSVRYERERERERERDENWLKNEIHSHFALIVWMILAWEINR